MIELLTSRELAIACWLAVIFIWASFYGKNRASFWSVLTFFLEWKILVLLALLVGYTGLIVFIYISLGLEYDRLWLDAIIWMFYGFYLLVKYITRKGYSHVWSDAIRENFRGVAFLELILHTYTFGFLAELVLIPFVTFVSLLGIVAKSEKDSDLVSKLIDSLLSVIGLAVLTYAIFQAVNNPDVIRTVDTLIAVSLPVILGIGFVPLMYFLLIASNYEQIFMRLNMGVSKSRMFRIRAKWEIMRSFGFSYKKTNSFVGPKSSALLYVTTIEELKEILSQ